MKERKNIMNIYAHHRPICSIQVLEYECKTKEKMQHSIHEFAKDLAEVNFM